MEKNNVTETEENIQSKLLIKFFLIVGIIMLGLFVIAWMADANGNNYMSIRTSSIEADRIPCRIVLHKIISGNTNYDNSWELVFSYESNYTPIYADCCYKSADGGLHLEKVLDNGKKWEFKLKDSVDRYDFVIIFNINNNEEFLWYDFYLEWS